MAKIIFCNNGDSNLAGAINAGDTTLNLTAGTGLKFPSPSGGNFFMLTLVKVVSGVPTYEIVKCTARTVDALTVVRGQEDTAATTFSAGDVVSNRLTRDTMDQFARLSEANTFAQPVTLPGDPTVDNHAANKHYVDTRGASLPAIHAAILSL